MQSLKDYVLWTRDLHFSQMPFSDADALVFAALVYLDLRLVFHNQKQIQLRNALPFFEENIVPVKMVVDNQVDYDFYTVALQSKRFGDLLVSHYVDEVKDEESLQFAALCFDTEGFRMLAFRGTDDSLVGWKEDLMMSFTLTPAQNKARAYVQANLSSHKPNYICGHSKGGNLALYAGLGLSDLQLGMVEKIYLLDSPGMSPEVIDVSNLPRLAPKVQVILPEFSVVGRMYQADFPHVKVVKSHAELFLGHDVLTWGIEYGDLAHSEQADPTAKWFCDNMMHWINKHNPKERAQVVDEFFAALMADGSHSIGDLSKRGIDGIESMLIKIMGTSELTRRAIAKIPEMVIFEDHFDSVDPLRRALWKRLLENPVLQCLSLVALGITMVTAQNYIIKAIVMGTVLVLTLIQIAYTLRKLHASKWSIEGNKERIYVSIAMCFFCAVLLIKDNALFTFGSFLFGIVCFILTGFSMMKLKKLDKDLFMRGILYAEILTTAIYGFIFLTAPESRMFAYNMGLGWALVVDGLLRLCYYGYKKKAPL